MTTILHISDIHRTPHEPVTNDEILLSLKRDADTWSGDGVPHPDLVVVSGDVTQGAEPDEYEEAADMLRSLLDHLGLDPGKHLLVVPGNHDVHWPTAEDAFRPRKSRPSLPPELVVDRDGLYLCVTDEAAYQSRFKHFRSFYRELIGGEYPSMRSDAYTLLTADGDVEVALAGFSSCDLNDSFRRHGSINVSAITAASEALSQYSTAIKIAVWHHDLNWRQETDREDFLSPDSLRYLGQAGFNLGLCGHTHRGGLHDLKMFGETAFPLVAAGSLCASRRERGDSVPRLYNVISVSRDQARVFVRSKEERASPWSEYAKWGPPGARRGYYDVKLRPEASPETTKEKVRAARPGMPSPFAEWNAKYQKIDEVVRTYVWTDQARRLQASLPQFVLGTRGSGKTALLKTLGPETQEASAEDDHSRLCVYVAMQADAVSAFTGKGWMPEQERTMLFDAMIACLWLSSFIESLRRRWPDEDWRSFQSELRLAAFGEWKGAADSVHLHDSVEAFGLFVLRALQCLDDGDRAVLLEDLHKAPLAFGVQRMVRAVVDRLQRQSDRRLSSVSICSLFDEVEHLTEWQQRSLYAILGQSGDASTVKVATLPYSHHVALQAMESVLAGRNDFEEIVLALAPDRDSETEDGTSQRFSVLAGELWSRRLQVGGWATAPPSLAEIFPDYDYYSVAAEHDGLPADEAQTIDALLDELSPRRRETARALRSDRLKFGSQFLRRYQASLRFRLARRIDPSGDKIPLYWGLRTVLRACDGNCRWFLQLLDLCWKRYWSRDGLRPLLAIEQHATIRVWAKGVRSELRHLPEKGDEVVEIFDSATSTFERRLDTGGLPEDGFRTELTDLAAAHTQAVALGIAYGVFVPDFEEGDEDLLKYPDRDVQMRLGYPYAVARALPLRGGAKLRIQDLRQVTMPWWRD